MTISSMDYKYVYRIDDKNVITFVDQDWLQFAKENDAPDLILEKVMLFTSISFVNHESKFYLILQAQKGILWKLNFQIG